ncbi:MAG TPA: hypothetical protein VGP07_03955 [Polyangia bacterium]|jgi:hypothetical protein
MLSGIAALTMGGCSFVLVKPPPGNYRPGARVECTTSRGAPIVDTIAAAANLTALMYIETRSRGPHDNVLANIPPVIEFAGLLLYTASAFKGYLDTSDCADDVERSRHPSAIPTAHGGSPTEDSPPEGETSSGPVPRVGPIPFRPNGPTSNLP